MAGEPLLRGGGCQVAGGHVCQDQLTQDGQEWTVRQGGPVEVWDAIESAVRAWQASGEPDISAVRLKVTPKSHAYVIGDQSTLRWEHRID